jgi:plastocyanin
MKNLIKSKNRFLIGAGFLFAILSLSNSCTKSTMATSKPGTNEVWIQNMAFDPSTITVPAGTAITWTNKDAVAHTVTSSTGIFDSGSINTNGTYIHVFSTAGSFQYICTIHPTMTATVIVN